MYIKSRSYCYKHISNNILEHIRIIAFFSLPERELSTMDKTVMCCLVLLLVSFQGAYSQLSVGKPPGRRALYKVRCQVKYYMLRKISLELTLFCSTLLNLFPGNNKLLTKEF